MNIDWSNFIATEDEGISSWTLAARLGDMLMEAEKRFGERDKEYSILGIEFHHGGPMTTYRDGRKHIVIQLSIGALEDHTLACWQLSHETIHLLSPLGKQGANILEEGLATHFSRFYLRDKLGIPVTAVGENYVEADDIVTKMLTLNENAIREMREREPTISHMTPEIIKAVFPKFPDDLAEKLCRKFVH